MYPFDFPWIFFKLPEVKKVHVVSFHKHLYAWHVWVPRKLRKLQTNPNFPKPNTTGWCSTPTLLLICSSFSTENGHPLLICSSLSTTQTNKIHHNCCNQRYGSICSKRTTVNNFKQKNRPTQERPRIFVSEAPPFNPVCFELNCVGFFRSLTRCRSLTVSYVVSQQNRLPTWAGFRDIPIGSTEMVCIYLAYNLKKTTINVVNISNAPCREYLPTFGINLWYMLGKY